MRVKDIIETDALKDQELLNEEMEENTTKSSKIRKGLKKVGRAVLNALGTIGDFASVAGMFIPAVGIAGTAISGVSRALSGVGAIGDIAGVMASTGELFNEKEQLAGMEA